MSLSDGIQTGQRAIPGFYYDAEKKKYFKIAHPASGGSYTASALSKRRKTEQLEEEKDRFEAIRTANAKSRKELKWKTPLALNVRHIIRRQQGHLKEQIYCDRLAPEPTRARVLSVSSPIHKFAYDADMDELYLASGRYIASHSMLAEPHNLEQSLTRPELNIQQVSLVAPLRTKPTSLAYGSSRTLLATSMGEGNYPAEVFLRTEYGGKIVTLEGSLWCSAIRPDSTQFIAAGTSILFCDANSEPESRRKIKVRGKTDVMSLDFLDSNVVALGCRNGALQLYDIRTSAHRTFHRFTHKASNPLGIAKVHALNMHQLIVSGLGSTLRLYDMRYIKHDTALVKYDKHKNEYDLNVNSLAVCGNIMAVAQAGQGIGMWHLDGTHLAEKATSSQANDLLFPSAGPHEHDTLWTMSQGTFNEWKFSTEASAA